MRNYTLDGRKPVPEPDFVKWAKWHESADRTVARDVFGDIAISTVFLGIDHGHHILNQHGNGVGYKPVLFETMVFGGDLDQEMDRYCT